MRELYTYQPHGQSSTVLTFLHQLEPKLREKLLWQFFRLSCSQLCQLREPHFKHFTLERYKDLYELRIKNKMLIRIIFTLRPNGDAILLHAFFKKQNRDTNQALEQALRILADLREHPEYAVKINLKKEAAM